MASFSRWIAGRGADRRSPPAQLPVGGARAGEPVRVETSVGRARLKSAPARVTRLGSDYRIVGAACGASIQKAEALVDEGDWKLVRLTQLEAARFFARRAVPKVLAPTTLPGLLFPRTVARR